MSKWSKYTKEDFLEILNNLFKEYGYMSGEKYRKISGKLKLPSMKAFKFKFQTNSWIDIINLLNPEIKNNCNHINSGRHQKYNKEDSLVILKSYYNQINMIPSCQDFSINHWNPSYTWYIKHFGSMFNACLEAKLVTENDRNQFLNRYCGKNIITGHDYEENKEDKVSIIHEKSKEERKELTIKEIIRISELLHKCPTAKEYNYYNKEGYSSSTIGKVFGISYRRLCEQYIGKDMMDIRKLPTNLSKEEQKELLGNELISAYNKLGFVPIQNDMKKYGLYSLTSYMNVFNKSYNEILNELGLPVNARYEIDKSNEILLNEFYKVFKSINRIPLGREFIKYGLEGVWNYRNKFGSIRKVCELLDIDYTKYYKVKNKAGIICFDDNGDTCRSVIEKDISNFFIMNKLNYEKEYKYSNLIKGDKRRFDWKVVINDKNFYIEYAGLYRENATHGIQIRYNNKIKNKLKSLGKCGFINQCIFIYPNDVYSKSLKEIFEPIFNINLKNLEYSRCNSAIKYNELSEEELFEMYKSIQVKTNDITVYNIIKENYSLYAEIINRYQNFYSFLSKHNIFCNKPKGYWNKETLNENFLYCFRKHNKILSFQEIRNECKIDLKLKGFYSAIQTYGGYEKILTNFKEYCINNNIII